MSRKKSPRLTSFDPSVLYFKPQGIPLRQLDEVSLNPDELEAIKLYEFDSNQQKEAAKYMAISQPTFARILDSAYKKIADALVNGKAIRINK